MASHRPSVFAIIKAILHAIAAILAILLLPYLVFCTINGRGVGYVIVAYVAVSCVHLRAKTSISKSRC